MTALIPFRPSSHSTGYGAADPGYPCIRKGATDQASGGAVSAVQEVLLKREDLDPSIESSSSGMWMSGNFDAYTDIAVRQFQADNGLDADGIVGPLTGAALGLKFQKCSSGFTSKVADAIDKAPEPLSLVDKAMALRYRYPVATGLGVTALVVGVVGGAFWAIERRRWS